MNVFGMVIFKVAGNVVFETTLSYKPSVLPYPYFYHLPKIHKSTTCPPGRPIKVSTDSFTSGLSHYINFFLQPMLLSYIKDSSHVIETLQNYKWETDYLWASLDVVSLYTLIPHRVGLEALQNFLSKDSNMNYRQAQFLVDDAGFCLEHNLFFVPGQILYSETWNSHGS